MKEFILTINVVCSDYNFIPEILRQLNTELKPYHIWHLILSKVPETIKIRSSLEIRMCLPKYLQHVGFVN